MKTLYIVVTLLTLSGCASMSPRARAALTCNPVAHALDLAMIWSLDFSFTLTQECVKAINEIVEVKSEPSPPSETCPAPLVTRPDGTRACVDAPEGMS